MISLRSTFAFALLTTSFAPLLAEDPQVNPREKLATALPEMIRQLEAKEYKSFVEQFAPPQVVKGITAEKPIDDFAKDFGKELAGDLLKALQAVKDAKPEMSDEGKKATFPLKDAIAGKKSLIFTKIEKYWYISN